MSESEYVYRWVEPEFKNPKFKPDINMRPHHLWIPEFKAALLHGSGVRLVEGFISRVDRENYDEGYLADIFGKTPEEKEIYKQEFVKYLLDLSALPDTANIHFDLAPDYICQMACAVGRHCGATNYLVKDHPTSVVDGETVSIKRLEHVLTTNGARRGEDFIRKDTVHVLSDFQGESVSRGFGTPGRPILFSSIIAKAGSVRRALAA